MKYHTLQDDKQVIGAFKPLAFGRRFSSGTKVLSNIIIPVGEARKENLPSIWVLKYYYLFFLIKPLTILPSSLAHIRNKSINGLLDIQF